MKKKLIIASIMTTTLTLGTLFFALTKDRLLTAFGTSGETNSFTLTKSNLTSHVWDNSSWQYRLVFTGSSLHHGDFTSDQTANQTYVYGYWGTEGYVDFDNPDYIFVATGDTSSKQAGAASFCFKFNFQGISKVNSCTYIYEDGNEEKEGLAYIDGLSVYDSVSNSYNTDRLALKSISISYTC